MTPPASASPPSKGSDRHLPVLPAGRSPGAGISVHGAWPWPLTSAPEDPQTSRSALLPPLRLGIPPVLPCQGTYQPGSFACSPQPHPPSVPGHWNICSMSCSLGSHCSPNSTRRRSGAASSRRAAPGAPAGARGRPSRVSFYPKSRARSPHPEGRGPPPERTDPAGRRPTAWAQPRTLAGRVQRQAPGKGWGRAQGGWVGQGRVCSRGPITHTLSHCRVFYSRV